MGCVCVQMLGLWRGGGVYGKGQGHLEIALEQAEKARGELSEENEEVGGWCCE